MTVGTPVAAAVAHARRRILEELREQGAVSSDTAAPLSLPRQLDRRALARLLREGLVIEDIEGQYYVDEETVDDAQETRGKIRDFFVVLAMLAMLVIVAFLLHGRM